MKRSLKIIFSLALVLVVALSAVGCKFTLGSVEITKIDGEVFYEIHPNDTLMTLTETTTFADYLNALKANGELEFEAHDTEYGLFIDSIEGVEPGANQYWEIFTNVEPDEITDWTDIYELNDVTYYSASVGLSGILVQEGVVLMIKLGSWEAM